MHGGSKYEDQECGKPDSQKHSDEQEHFFKAWGNLLVIQAVFLFFQIFCIGDFSLAAIDRLVPCAQRLLYGINLLFASGPGGTVIH